MPVDSDALLEDLRGETSALDRLLSGLPDAGWDVPTPADGWAIRDQVSHLAYFDDAATLAATDPDKFRAEAADLLALGDQFPDRIAERYRTMHPAELHAWFRRARPRMLAVMATVDPTTRLPWYGPDMSAASAITARLMETWAHGNDIADALGVRPAPTDRLRHIAHLGVRTLSHSFRLRSRPVPTAEVYVDLTGPDGQNWCWGAPHLPDTVRGSALEFCLVVTQRRHVADTGLTVNGRTATEWMSIAQAYAGAPGPGRPAGTFVGRIDA